MQEKWTKWHVNRALLSRLRRKYGTSAFHNADAYDLYTRFHAQFEPGLTSDTYWREMNVRNTLCAAAYRGILIRLGPGHYRFPSPEKGA
jgi:hypothetical protein